MSTIRHLRSALLRALRQTVGPLIGVCVVGYFAYHTVHGDRGLVALTHLQNEVAEAQATLTQVRGEREELERRANLLRPDHLDPDLLEERARAVLNYSHPDELIILLPRRPATH
ncbi:FtsB family cell division protein [Niveispirillum irakense]|uniref:FtsB family cell division protein n=1 Tax=Niveispirillum irakense TaxID=34011 RepID=UPI001AEC44A6|nr:septum formation initiator family protein [Niveispirillum irakense]